MRITESENAELSVKPFDNQHKRSSILHPDLLHGTQRNSTRHSTDTQINNFLRAVYGS